MRILIVDDDVYIAKSIKKRLWPQHVADLVETGKDAVSIQNLNIYDAIVLDLGLPDISGLEVCKALRDANFKGGILVLTALWAVDDKVRLLDAGADDYLTKPFKFEELDARLRAVVRRLSTQEITNGKLRVGDLLLDTKQHRVWRDGQEVTLRRKEFLLLEYLMRNKNMTITRNMIIDNVWEMNADVWETSVDVHINHLRNKIDKPFKKSPLIKTVYGIGYRLETKTNKEEKGEEYANTY